MNMTTLATPVALWQSLGTDAGLELRLKNGRPGRDADIEAALRKALAVPRSARSLDAWLAADAGSARPKVSVERFLVEVLKSQAGFAQMMQDILDTLVAADARRASHALSIAFEFQDMDDPIVQTLAQFRETVERTQKVLQRRPRLPDSARMWSISAPLRRLLPAGGNERPDHFPAVLPLPGTGDPQLDEQLAQVGRLVVDVQALWTSRGEDRPRVIAAAQDVSPRSPELVELHGQLGAASDFWDVSAIAGLQQAVWLATSGQVDAEKLRGELAKALESLEWGDAWVDQTVRDLLDILSLPAWQRRHELYSVWVGTRLLEVARIAAPGLRFNPVDGVLSFAFGGSRLATYERQGKEYEIWAELRSALVGPSPKRKEKIQPDFRVVEAGLSPAGERTVYVLECKHYLRSRAANFTTAARDYARSCPGATVHVVNHGPANDTQLRAALPAGLHAAVQFIGDARAEDAAAAARLGEAIREVLFAGVAAPGPAGVPLDRSAAVRLPAGCVGQIFLEWDGSLADMDLALHVIAPDGTSTQSIDFRHVGALDGPPFARFHEDIRQGPGVERIDVGAWHFDRYEVRATNYSGSGRMTPEALQCRIVTQAGSALLRCPPGLAGSRRDWCVAALVVRGGTPEVVPIDA